MTFLKKIILLLFIITFINSCKKESLVRNEYEYYIIEGKTLDSSYKFCSITYVDIKYSYRIDKWTFNSSKGYKLAEGEYDIINEKVFDHGGCTYSYLRNSVNLEKWKFWDEYGQEIEPSKRTLYLIKPREEKENPFEKDYSYYKDSIQ